MIFSMNHENTKVVDNSLILLVLNFYDHMPVSLRAMLVASALSCFACALYSFEGLTWLP